MSTSYTKNTGIFFAGLCIYTEHIKVFPNDLRMTIPSSPLMGKITTNISTSESMEPRNMLSYIEKNGINSADGIKVANQLTLKKKIVLKYLSGPMWLRGSLKVKSEVKEFINDTV